MYAGACKLQAMRPGMMRCGCTWWPAACRKSMQPLCVAFDSARCCARPTFPAVCRQLLAVADSLLSLAAAASRVLSSGHVPTWLPMQVEAGCLALASCAMLARAAQQLPAASAFKIVAASGLALRPGTLLLTGLVQEADGANAQQVVVRLLRLCWREERRGVPLLHSIVSLHAAAWRICTGCCAEAALFRYVHVAAPADARHLE